jgi:acyl-CoA synthetase (NDP forming)
MRAFAETTAKAAGASDKVIVVYGTSALGAVDRQLVTTLHTAGVPYLAGTQRAMQALGALQGYRRYRERPETEPLPRTLPAMRSDLPGGVLPFMTARTLLMGFGIPVIETELVGTPDEAVSAADRLGYPVALKVEARGLTHRSDAGGVALGCGDAKAVRAGFDRIVGNVRRTLGRVDGVLVQPMARCVVEAFAGVVRDPLLGPAVLFGLGGIFVETLRDTVIEVPPIDVERAREMVVAIRARNVLLGARGAEPADVEAIGRVIVALADLALVYGDRVVSLDLNPLMVGPVGRGVLAVDALVELTDGTRSRVQEEEWP